MTTTKNTLSASLWLLVLVFCLVPTHSSAQKEKTVEEKNEGDIAWSFDGRTLTIERNSPLKFNVSIPDYDVNKNIAPWVKQQLPIKKVIIGDYIARIGACAFANCAELETVEFYNDKTLTEIGWGAFMKCSHLFNFSVPINIQKIGSVAFARCTSLRSVKIPAQAKVDDYAYMSCPNLNVIEIARTAILGKNVFSTEIKEAGQTTYRHYHGEIRCLPDNVTTSNCQLYGLAPEAVEEYTKKVKPQQQEENAVTSVDTDIPENATTRSYLYALIIGNQSYRFAPDVPCAHHDATIFAEYCKKTLGVPAENIHLSLDATKHMIMEQELTDWLQNTITKRDEKTLIVYYAGHGMPDTKDHNRAYLLPTDVYGTSPQHGIPLDKFYTLLGNLGFDHVTVFMDACFSGINRNNDAVNHGERATETEAEDTDPTTGNMVVFCAAQGNETAQGYFEKGHGLFTYYLLKELQSSGGNITYGELTRKVQKNVADKAPSLGLKKKQTPRATASQTLQDAWQQETL